MTSYGEPVNIRRRNELWWRSKKREKEKEKLLGWYLSQKGTGRPGDLPPILDTRSLISGIGPLGHIPVTRARVSTDNRWGKILTINVDWR